MTITGVILFPIFAFIIFLPWRMVMVALLVSSLLSDAALVNFGSIGLQPVYFLMLLVIARTIAEIALGERTLSLSALRLMAPLGILMLISTVVLLIAIVAFQGKIIVVSGTAGFELHKAEPYSFRRENIAQMLYLAIDIICVYCLAHLASRRFDDSFARMADLACLVAGYVAGAVTLWDVAHAYLNVPFAPDFFHSNAGYSASFAQRIGTSVGVVTRIEGPFAEPSALGYYFSGFILYAWNRYRSSASILFFGLLLLSIVCLILSTGTTSYFALAFFMVVVAGNLAAGARRFLPRLAKGGRREIWMTLTFSVGMIAVAAYVLSDWETLSGIFTAVVIDKGDTTSFDQRSGVDLMALQIVFETHGIGIGLGSHKPNNLVMTLVSNLGIAGTAAFAVFLWRLFFQKAEYTAVAGGLRAFLLGLLMVHVFSNPGLCGAILWILFGLILGLVVQARTQQAVVGRFAPGEPDLGRLAWTR